MNNKRKVNKKNFINELNELLPKFFKWQISQIDANKLIHSSIFLKLNCSGLIIS